MIKVVAFLAAMLSMDSVFAEENPLDDPHFTLAAAKTFPVALRQFSKDQPKADQDHFVVYVRESADSVEIEFVPDPDPVTEACGEKECAVTMSFGGVTSHGFGITYVVDKKKLRVVKTVRAR